MRDRLIELINQKQEWGIDQIQPNGFKIELFENKELADYLLANGVVVLDWNVVTPKNRPLITQIANMPLNDVCELIKAKQAEELKEREG